MTKAKNVTTKNAEIVKTTASSQEELMAKQADLLAAKQSHSAGELTNPRVLRALRREIARIMTTLNANNKETK